MLTDILIILIILLIYWYINIPQEEHPSKYMIYVREGYKPFEPENTLLNRNPYDDINYIMPEFKVKGPVDFSPKV